jgi:hypothetical protein
MARSNSPSRPSWRSAPPTNSGGSSGPVCARMRSDTNCRLVECDDTARWVQRRRHGARLAHGRATCGSTHGCSAMQGKRIHLSRRGDHPSFDARGKPRPFRRHRSRVVLHFCSGDRIASACESRGNRRRRGHVRDRCPTRRSADDGSPDSRCDRSRSYDRASQRPDDASA